MSGKQRLFGLCLIVLATAQTAIAQPPPPALPLQAHQLPEFVTDQPIRRHIEYLASVELKGRSGPDARRAAEYITRHFRQWGLEPLFEGESFYQEIPGSILENGERRVAGRNIGAWIPGSDPTVRDEFSIVSAHYDHLGIRNGEIYRGADDNASGVAMMLEVARRMSHAGTKPRRSVVFVGFDLEERMLWGSRWFAAHPPWPLQQVKLFITADMIGRSLGDLQLPIIFVLGSERATQLKQTLDRVGTPPGLEVARLGIDLIGTRSDYGPFRDRHVPFLFFSSGEHPDYHTPRDVPERIDYAKVARVTELVLAVCRDVGGSDATPVWIDKVGTDVDEARSLNRLATLLLQSKKSDSLSDLQRMVVKHAQTKTRQIVQRGSMSPLERQWLVRVAQLMMLSVF